MCKYSVKLLGLVYKTFINKSLEKLRCSTERTNCIHCSRNAGFFWKAEQGYFSLTTKIHFFRDILPERVPCSAAEWSTWMAALSLSLLLVRARARSSGRNAHIRSFTVVYVSKSHSLKTLWNFYQPGSEIFGTETLCYMSKLFFETLSMFSMRIQLFNRVNNAECMKQHCTPPPPPPPPPLK